MTLFHAKFQFGTKRSGGVIRKSNSPSNVQIQLTEREGAARRQLAVAGFRPIGDQLFYGATFFVSSRRFSWYGFERSRGRGSGVIRQTASKTCRKSMFDSRF